MDKELSKNFDLTGTSASDVERQEAFKACADPAENARQIAMIGEQLEKDIFNAFETAKLAPETALMTDAGKELAAAVGPRVMLTQRDNFFAEKLGDRFLVNHGDVVYYTKSKDTPMNVITASMTDNGAPMPVNVLQTMKGYDVPVPVAGNRMLLNFEYDDPRLANANWSSRSKAVDMARYRIRKSIQDMMVNAWVGGFTASFNAAVMHELPAGRVHPTTNIIDVSVGASGSGKLDYTAVEKVSSYFDTFGFPGGQKIIFVSNKRFNDIKGWVSTTTHTDAGLVFAQQIFKNGGSVDSIPVYDTLVVKQNTIPDDMGYCLLTDDGVSPTLGIYQWGKIQTLPSQMNKPLRASFDVYIPGICGLCFDQIRVAKLKFA